MNLRVKHTWTNLLMVLLFSPLLLLTVLGLFVASMSAMAGEPGWEALEDLYDD